MATVEAQFRIAIKDRILEYAPQFSDEQVGATLETVVRTIHSTFENQGLNLSAIVAGNEIDDVPVFKYAAEEVRKLSSSLPDREAIYDCVLTVIRKLVYSGTPSEREYLIRLSKLQCLEFVIRGDTSVIRYFSNVFRQLRLYVGADVLVRALSEACVAETSRATTNSLALMKKAGASLILTQRVLDEVYSHVFAECREFENQYKSWEGRATIDATKNVNRILIRAYFYAKLEPDRHEKKINTWHQYLELIGGSRTFDASTEREAGG